MRRSSPITKTTGPNTHRSEPRIAAGSVRTTRRWTSCLSPRTTVANLLAVAAHLLSLDEDSPTARIEAEVLLRHALDIDRARLYCRLDQELLPGELERFVSLLDRRLVGEPVAYIIGHREFYGLDFLVDRRVLIPRPETESLVEAVLGWFGKSDARTTIADVGTGSGAVAISLATNLPHARIIAVDSSFEALEVAAMNVALHGVEDRVSLVCGDLLEPVAGRLDVVVANLPYIPRSRLAALPHDIRDFEPLSALDGGEDGLDPYRRLFAQASQRYDLPELILIEIDPDQREAILELVHRHFPNARVSVLKDYAALDRVVSVDIV